MQQHLLAALNLLFFSLCFAVCCSVLQQHLLPALHSLPVRMCEITDFHV